MRGSVCRRASSRWLRDAGHTVYAPTLNGCAEPKHQVRAGVAIEYHAAKIAELLFYEDPARRGYGRDELRRHGAGPRCRSGAA
jgi:hypothetical protein